MAKRRPRGAPPASGSNQQSMIGTRAGRLRTIARMSEEIPFDRSFDLPAGEVEETMPGLRRLMADNPSPFTYKGTVSYIVGRGRVAILDPGPEHEQHIAKLLDAVRNETVTHVFVTHTHRDHSP